MKKNNLCLVIPFVGNYENIQNLLYEITKMSVYPKEIVIVNSSLIDLNLQESINNQLKTKDIEIKILNKPNLFPGAARNIGILNTDCELIAFLDTLTIPSKDWLKNGLNLLEKDKNIQIVFGTTFYLALNKKEKIIRASTFGEKKHITLPGTILKKEILLKCGMFLENVRAGEDADWILRTKLNQIESQINLNNLEYKGLLGLEYISVIKKWYRNYSNSSNLPYMNSHLRYYYVGLILIIILVSYNWNSVVAQWKIDSNVYIPHITKISISFIIATYIVIRGIILPIKKNVNKFYLFPLNFLKISILSGFIDLSKIFAFFKKIKIKNKKQS